MNARLFVLTAFAASAILTAAGWAQEWTRFRGPNGSGLAQALKLPAAFGEQDFNWKIELPGGGNSSPVIWGERVFITANPAGTGKTVLLCVNAADGKVLWQREHETNTFRKHADNSYATATPALDAERVYLLCLAPEGSVLVAFEQKDGREVWRKDLGPFNSQHGPGTSPIVEDGTVIVDFDPDEPKSFVAAFEAATGAERWRWEHPGKKHTSSTPCLFRTKSGVTQVVTMSKNAGLTGLDFKTGKVAWQLPDLISKRCVASPLVAGDLVFAQCGEGQAESFVYAVRPAADGKSAQKVYEVIRTGGYVPTPIAVGPLLFLWKENGLVTCLRAANNEQVWSERVQGPFYGSPIAVDGRLYSFTRRGELVVLNAADKFQELARIPLGEGSFASPALSGGRMYLRTFTHLISVGK